MTVLETAIKKSAALRGNYKFKEAIDVIDGALAGASPEKDDLWAIANLEGLKAAEECGDAATAKRFAVAIRQTDPDLPTISKYF